MDAKEAHDCAACSRLAAFLDKQRQDHPDWHNRPVPSFGPNDARLLVVGLAPGLRGANRTGRPFTGDYAGDLLYPTLLKYGFATGRFGARPDDGLRLQDARVTNAVRCVPPENRPIGDEISRCNGFLKYEIETMPHLRAVMALGTVAHGAVLSALGLRKSTTKFIHGAVHRLDDRPVLIDSYHCSRYNTNTGRLTTEMFEAVFSQTRDILNEFA